MKIIEYSSIPPTRFDNKLAQGVSGRVVIGSADHANNFCMRVFEVAPGGHTPRHTHPWEHEIFIHTGSGEIWNEDWHPLSAGHAIFVPGNEEHQIRNRSDVPLIFVCLIPSGAPEL